MFYYRYRPLSELSIKELMYNEIYFTSTSECNDPYDGKAFISFEADEDKWKRLIQSAWNSFLNPNKEIWIEQLSKYLVDLSPLTYEESLNLNYVQILTDFKLQPDIITAKILSNLIINYINSYSPKEIYFASFSHENNNLLMWSHYASMHQGYCLVFRAIENKLYQCPNRKKMTISRKTPYSIFSQCNYSIEDSFTFQDVLYNLNSTSKDAFYSFPEYILGRKADEQEIEEIIKWRQEQGLEKHECWKYENESRLILTSPESWIFGEKIEYSQYERLFHYHPNQLVGIILGAKMYEKQKSRIREIIKEHMHNIGLNACNNFPIFDFVLFEAELPNNQREVTIKPEEIFNLTGVIRKDDEKFEERLQAWEEGWAIVINGSSGSRKKF